MGLTKVLYKINIPSEFLLLIFLIIIPTVLLAYLPTLLQLRLGLKLSEKKTPKSFSSRVTGINSPIKLYYSLTFFLPICITLHLFTLNAIWFFTAQLHKTFKSCGKSILSCVVSAIPHSLESSANFNILFFIPNSRSLINIVNKRGPRIDPYGTPLETSAHSEYNPLIPTL